MQPADSATKYCQASHTCSDGINNPFDFMEMISIEKKTNFFESRVGEYSLSEGNKSKASFDFGDKIDF